MMPSTNKETLFSRMFPTNIKKETKFIFKVHTITFKVTERVMQE